MVLLILDCCAVARICGETKLSRTPDIDFVHTVRSESKKEIARY